METSEIIKSFCERIGIKYEPNAYGACSFKADGFLVTISDLRGLDQIALVGDFRDVLPLVDKAEGGQDSGGLQMNGFMQV